MAVEPVQRTAPALLDCDAALDRYLRDYSRIRFDATDGERGIDLATWTSLGDDAIESTWEEARRLGLPLARLSALKPDPAAIALLTPETARQLRAVPLRAHGGMVAIALEHPGTRQVQDTLEFLSRDRVIPVVASPREVRDGIARYYDQVEDRNVARQLGIDPETAGLETNPQEAQRLAKERPVIGIVNTLIADAVARRASDIHLRPGERDADVLYRIDDELVPVRRLLRALRPAIVGRIKVLAGMNLAEHRKPQDGRASFLLDDGRKVDLRVSVLPAVHGESVVIRLLDNREQLWNLDQLGLADDDRERLRDAMDASHGMFLATGPTGCGKSTTLYAMLLELRKRRINVLTIEDPVEFRIEDIQQMQVNPASGFTFAAALRNFLRHDPDAIMVGEIRDRETAEVAVESALTGHLLLSTLHTNTAATTVTRLLDLGVEAYLLRATLLAVMSQRLVRLTCPHCREVERVDAHVRERLGVADDEVFHAGRGCDRCEGLGVLGRRAVYELMVVTPTLRALIVPGANADALHAAALEDGMVPITRAALRLAREGTISLSEVWRVRAD